MVIEIVAPTSLPLGVAQIETDAGRRTCLVGFTLQHPPVHLLAQAHPGLFVTGASEKRARASAKKFRQHVEIAEGIEAEIELAIPSQMGLSSEPMLGLAMARAMAGINELPLEDTVALAKGLGLGPQDALALWGFDQGGFLVVDTEADEGEVPPIIRRHSIIHEDRDAWGFVLVLPRVPQKTPDSLESECLSHLLEAAPHLSDTSGQIVADQLWPALENDDFPEFAQALTRLHKMNGQALDSTGYPQTLTSEAQGILNVMQEHGSLACGQSLVGLGLYAMVKGSSDAIELRQKLREHWGYHAGTTRTTITDNDGARHVFRDEDLANVILPD